MRSPSNAAKWVYFLYFAAAAALLPHLSFYYRSLGLTGQMIGILAAIAPAASLLGAWTLGGVADVSGRHRAILSIAMLTAIGASQLFLLGTSFSFLLFVALIFALAAAPIMPLIDNSALDILAQSKERYGRIRLWGALGWGVAAPAAEILIGRVGLGSYSHRTACSCSSAPWLLYGCRL